MGLFDDPVGYLNGGLYGPAGQDLTSYLGKVVSGQYAAPEPSSYDPNRSFAQNALDPRGIEQAMNVALSFGPGATKKLDRIDALTADRLSAERGGPSAGSPVSSFSAIQAAEQPQGIKAYHGSPYDFDAFDAGKVGTGEGAQAYGHGLYFADSEPVARSYRDALGQPAVQIGGEKTVPTRGSPEDIALAHLETAHDAQSSSPYSYARRSLRSAYDLAPNTPTGTMRKDLQQAMDVLGRWQEQGAVPASAGKMYEVNIKANPEQFLDWDKPLSQQSSPVREALQSHPAVAQSIEKQSSVLGDKARDPTGQGAYAALTGWRRGVDLSPPADAVSQATDYLRGAGVPGIRYLDQGSRGVGQGTNNYVVFDPSIIEILRKYGLAGLTGGAGAAGGLYGNSQNY